MQSKNSNLVNGLSFGSITCCGKMQFVKDRWVLSCKWFKKDKSVRVEYLISIFSLSCCKSIWLFVKKAFIFSEVLLFILLPIKYKKIFDNCFFCVCCIIRSYIFSM
jgi:hypothetical protein